MERSLIFNNWEITLNFQTKIFKFTNLKTQIGYKLEDKLTIDRKIIKSFLNYDFSITDEKKFIICGNDLNLTEDLDSSEKIQEHLNIIKNSKEIKEGIIHAISYTPILDIYIAAIESENKEIKLIKYDGEFKSLKENTFMRNKNINLITINDDGNKFLTSTYDYRIIIWDIEQLKIIKTICDAAHNCEIQQLFFWNDNIISLGVTEPIKIWEEKNDIYQAQILKRINKIFSALLLNDVLVTCGYGGLVFYNLQSKEIDQILEKVKCDKENVFRRITNDKLIVDYKNELTIVSIESKNVLQKIDFNKNLTHFFMKGTCLLCLLLLLKNGIENNFEKPEYDNEKKKIEVSTMNIKETEKEKKFEVADIFVGENENLIVDEIEIINDLPINGFITYSANQKINIYKIIK